MTEPTEQEILARAHELVQAICGTGKFEGQPHSYRMGEFTMQIPANESRDADLVFSKLIKLHGDKDAEIARLRAEVEAAKGMTVHILADNERLCELVKDLQPKVCGIDQSPCPYAPCDGCVPNLTVKLEHEEGQVDRLNGLLVEQYNTCRCRALTAQLERAKGLLGDVSFDTSIGEISVGFSNRDWIERRAKFMGGTLGRTDTP